MRRLTAIVIVALAWGVPLTPLLRASAPAVPACCLRHGAHHCFSEPTDGLVVAGPAAHCPYRQALVVHSPAGRMQPPVQFDTILRAEYRHLTASITYIPEALISLPRDRGPPSSCSLSLPSRFA